MISNPLAPNPTQLMAKLRMMPDAELFQYAQMHQSDPYVFPLTFQESNARKAARAAQQMQPGQPPKVVQQDLQQMAPQQAPRMGAVAMPAQAAQAAPQQQALPEDQGIGQLPAQNMQNMAEGGIVGYAPGGSTGADDAFEKAFKKVLQFEGGAKYVKNDAGKGPTKYGINQTANPDVDVKNLTEDQAKEIYRKRYWNAIDGDALAAKNPHLATIAFDAAVNQGPNTAKQMVAQAGDNPYELLRLRQQRYVDLKNQNPEKYGQYLGGWTDRVSSLQKDFERDRNKAGLPALTPGAQALAATGSESMQPDLDSSKAGVITSGLAALGNAATGAYEALTPSFAPSTTPAQALGRTAATASPLGLVGLTGAGLSTGAANALSNATPEQLDQLSGDIGSDTGFAAAITNAPNRPPEKPAMPYGEQMVNAAKALVGHPDVYPSTPAPAPAAPNTTANAYPSGIMGGVAAPAEAPEETTTAEAPAEAPKKGGMDYNDLMIKFGLGLMAGKSPNALTNVGEAGIGALQMTAAEKKAQAEQAYHEALAEQARAHGALFSQMGDIKEAQMNTKERIALAQIIATQNAKIDANVMLSPEQKATQKAMAKSQAADIIMGQRQQMAGVTSAPPPSGAPGGVTVSNWQ